MTPRGFTLIEMLVVLVIAGLLSGVVIPQALTWVGTYRRHGEKNLVLQKLNQLSLTAYETGRGLQVSDSHALKLPRGWSFRVIKPFEFAFNGACTAGEILLIAPDASQSVYSISPPRCSFVESDRQGSRNS